MTYPVDSAIFTCWVAQILLPVLTEKAVIIMDNATFHKQSDMQKLIANAGHSLLYLPPYSPDLNSIEKKWAQTKQIRKATLCTIDELFTDYLM
jgi:transposase